MYYAKYFQKLKQREQNFLSFHFYFDKYDRTRFKKEATFKPSTLSSWSHICHSMLGCHESVVMFYLDISLNLSSS